MRGSSSVVLLALVTLSVCVDSYSKIPDGVFLPDGYHYRKSSSNSNSNSYSQSNQEDAEINGNFGGQSISGSKASGYSTSGGSHSQSSSFSSGSFSEAEPVGLIAGSTGSFAGISTGSSDSQNGYGSLVNLGSAGFSLNDNDADTPTGFSSPSYDGFISESSSSGINGGTAGSSLFVMPGSTGSYSTNAIQGQSSSSNFDGSSPSKSGLSRQSTLSRLGASAGSSAVSASFESSELSGSAQKGTQYWWNGPNSPFGLSGRPVGGCNSNACTIGGIFELNKGNGGHHTFISKEQAEINVQGNPFLNTENTDSSSINSGTSTEFSTAFGSATSDKFANNVQNGSVSFNPFVPVFKPGHTSDSPSDTTFSSNVPSSATFADTFTTTIGATNPFLKPGSSSDAGLGIVQVPHLPSLGVVPEKPGTQTPTNVAVGSTNPFLNPGSGSSVITSFTSSTTARPYKPINNVPQVPVQVPSFTNQKKDAFFGSSGFQAPEVIPQQSSDIEGGLSVTCSGQGKICVNKNLCVNGKVNTNGQGLMQVRMGVQQCDIDHEVCCLLDGYSGAPSKVGIIQGVDYASSTSTGSSSSSFASTSNVGNSGTEGNQFDTNNSQSKIGFGQFGFHSSSNLNQPSRFGLSDYNGFSTSGTNLTQYNIRQSSNGQSGSGLIHVAPTNPPTLITASGSPDSITGLIGVAPIGDGFFKTTPQNSYAVKGNANFGIDNNVRPNAGTHVQASPGSFGLLNTNVKPVFGSTFNNKQNNNMNNNKLFGYSTNSEQNLSNGEFNYKDSTIKTGGSILTENNGYLPPLGSEPSSNVPSFSQPPQEVTGEASDSVPNTKLLSSSPTSVQEIAPQVGCAAALICVEEKFCSLDGVISSEPVVLSSIQIERRVPLSSCRNPDNDVVGKCCRDPNYVDPWPTGNLPLNYSGGFDERGFPTFLNIAKTLPPKKPTTTTKTPQPTKTFLNPNLNLPPKLAQRTFPQQIANIPNQISSGISNILPNNPFFKPTEKPEIAAAVPEGSSNPGIAVLPPASLPQIPTELPSFISNFSGFPGLPSLPNFPNPLKKTNYHSASSNQNPAVLTPNASGNQCGVKNKVQRPSDLSDVDVAFGEIPWQAMILSTRDRKLLCSGVIATANAILTAAHCVNGLKPSEVSIKSGEWKLGYELKHEEPLPFEIVKVAFIVFHPGYQSGAYSYDLAILFLEHPVKFDQHVNTLCISDSPQIKPESKCISTGWGKTVLQVHVAGAVMHSIDVDLIPSDSCKQRILNADHRIDIDDTLVCTKAQKQSNNMCQVDVGGPLACDRGDGFYELKGVYSQDTGCLPTNQVATFAVIDTDWINKTLQSPPVNEIDTSKDESLSSSNVNQQIEPHSLTKEQPCDCQKSNLPSKINQYLPPL